MRSDIEKDSCENFTLRLEADIRMSDNQLPELVLAKSSSLWILRLEKIQQDECG